METLGMTYNEVMHAPYVLLLFMQHDKIRVDYSESGKAEETETLSGKEMLKRKRGI
ncbi:MAG: hypothetical protein LBU37_13395 [Tannerellaceae bacterium]|jgi:hypothetical protein|nr:hypothetical protein [Tannerellaceae bacterium]